MNMGGKITFINFLDAEEKLKWEVREWRNEDFVRANMFNNKIISEDEHKNFLNKLQYSSVDKYYIAFYEGEPFGILNMHIDFNNKKLEFGYYLSKIKYIDGGYGAILEYALLNHAFFNLKIQTVFCRTLAANKKVVALHKRFGFDILSCDEAVCHQSIDSSQWIDKKAYIENVLCRIIDLEDIGKLY